ncbi:glycoside hydrolase [Vibrio sp. VPAP30]|uniref:glycoside hydrolase n=1 Tax=Vibrio sp. VPAP30 TaxID=1647102 RepID=UPI0006589A4B|nr:glycoside hydrolase [Vibrio sp. VPAP30]KLN63452.1 glycosyl hydrolase [Vibrio sp. VPAP30]
MLFKPTKTFPLLAALTSSILSTNAIGGADTVTLKEHKDAISINPNSLAIKWNDTLVNQSGLAVDGSPQRAEQIEHLSGSRSRWVLKPSNIVVDAKLTDTLTLSFTYDKSQPITRGQPVTVNWLNLPEDKTNELYLPFSEGMRVPTADSTWIKYLSESWNGVNTTQDLKMPFWTAKQGTRYISWHLLTATNNELSFSEQANKLDMAASHQFTTLNFNQPFTVSVSIGNNWLSGAKQYRQWRIDNDLTSTLAEKKKANPNIEKLIGASQVYLFGSDGISVQDVSDWWGLHTWLFKQSQLSIEKSVRKELKDLAKGKDWLSRYHKQLMVDSINLALNEMFQAPAPTMANNTIEDQFKAAQNKRQWLAKNARQYLAVPATWGQAISTDMVNQLQDAGLTRLWLGFDNWMPAFYQPNVVNQAKKAGYLVGTYDSYNTAIPRGLNNGWLTAQLPKQMRNQCAIEQADGSKKKGFRGNGYYLNPSCEMKYVKKRIADILRFGHFDSLFIDADATSMVREDYHLSTSESNMLEGFNTRMQTIVSGNDVVLGSEDGNSLTTSGIAFAHGLETVGFGWRDKEMKKDRNSPYFLGRWYPDYKPEFFFKPARVKEPYKTLLFSPKYRIPLYQAVFHDEVINSHHWHSDSLKFSDVKIERDLTAMLYNVPAMVHLSRDEVTSPSSPRLIELRNYQQGYKPLHKQLWDKQLVSFEWLDDTGEVQQTQFSDGSKIIANFSGKPFKTKQHQIAKQSILALLKDSDPISWQPLNNNYRGH